MKPGREGRKEKMGGKVGEREGQEGGIGDTKSRQIFTAGVCSIASEGYRRP